MDGPAPPNQHRRGHPGCRPPMARPARPHDPATGRPPGTRHTRPHGPPDHHHDRPHPLTCKGALPVPSDAARKAEIRAYMAANPGVRYGEVARLIEQAHNSAATAVVVAVVNGPIPPIPPTAGDLWPDPDDPRAAAAAQQEAIWIPAATDRPCPCTGQCRHGQPCVTSSDTSAPCVGRLRHTDRVPGSETDLLEWFDVHECDTCEREEETSLRLLALPWGDVVDGRAVPFFGTRHPELGDPRDPANQVMCTRCGWTNSMVCPECPGCGCYTLRCSGWRHGHYMTEEEQVELNECPEGGGDRRNHYRC